MAQPSKKQDDDDAMDINTAACFMLFIFAPVAVVMGAVSFYLFFGPLALILVEDFLASDVVSAVVDTCSKGLRLAFLAEYVK